MGFIRTKYEDSENNNVKFDVSEFDYSRTDDDFPTDVQDDVATIMDEHGDLFKIIEVDSNSETTDSMGNLTDIDEDDYFYAIALLQPISQKDRQNHGMGIAAPGTQKAYFLHQYTTTSAGVDTDHEVKAGYILEDRNGKRWRMTKLMGEWYMSNAMGYKAFILQSINLNEQ